jgi:hypothetical protein
MRFSFFRPLFLVAYALMVLLLPASSRANFGTALSFNGTSSYVSIPVVNFSSGNTMTLEAWVKPNDITTTGYSDIIREQQVGNGPDWLVAFQNNGTFLTFGLHAGLNYQELRVPINAADYVDGNWHHIAATYDGATKTLYKDGVQIGTDSQTGNVAAQANVCGIGVYLNGGTAEFFNGAIDEVREWSIVRSAADINATMFQPLTGSETGLAACWHFDEGTGSFTSDSGPGAGTGTLVNNPVWIDSLISDGSAPLAITRTASNLTTNSAALNGKIYPFGFSTMFYFDYGTTTSYGSQTTPVDIGSGSAPVQVSSAISNLSPAVAYHYRVVAMANGTLNYGNDKIFTTAGPIGGNALNFNGSSSYVLLPALNLSASNTMSLEAWIKPNDITTQPYSDIVRQQASSVSPDWLLGFQNNGNLLAFGLRTTSGYQELHLPIRPGDFADGKWHHIAATYDGTTKRLYRDGLQIGSIPQSGNVSFAPGAAGTIGANPVAVSEFFNGTIEEVRIWNVTRSSTDITANLFTSLFQQSGLAACYHMDEGSGTTTADSTGFNHTGSLINNPTWVVSTVPSFLDPLIFTGTISNLTTSSATLSVAVNPFGAARTAYLAFGLTTNYDGLTAPQALGDGLLQVNLTNTFLGNLVPLQGYHYRVVVTNANGTFFSPDKSFFTLGNSGGTALNFNGTNSYITAPVINLSASNTMTLTAWIKPTDITTAANSDIIRQQHLGGGPDWLVSFQNNGTLLSFGLNAGGTYKELQVAINPADYVDGSWHHIAATYDGTTKTLYKDGSPIGSTNQTGNILFIGNACGIGAYINSTVLEFFHGLIDEVQVWNTARNATQINQFMTHELTGSENGLTAYFRFDEGTGTALGDLTGNGHDGTLVNSPNWVTSTAPLLPAPTALTGFASSATTNSATLNGTVNPNGLAAMAYFNYGLTTNYTNVTSSQNIGGGSSPVPVASSISALLPGQPYHYRIASSNGSSTIFGKDRTFFTPGPLAGKALSFNGTSSYIRLPVIDLSASNTLTLEAWIKPVDITTTANSDILRQQAFTTTDWLLGFENHGTILSFGLRTGSTYQELQIGINPADFADGNWHHIAATYDGTTKRVYRDGVLIGSAAQTGNVAFTATNNSIGASYNGTSGSEFFNGLIDEVRIWAIARSANEINQYLNRSLTGAENGLLAYWRFDEGTSTSANDASGNGRAGILIGGPVWVNSGTPLLALQVSITGFSPAMGSQGASISISGTNLLAVTSVLFNGVNASFTNTSNSSLTAVVPAGASTGPVTLMTPSGNVTSTNNFLIDNVPPSIALSIPQNATFVTNLSTINAVAADNVGGSGVNSVVFYIQRESDLDFWTGSTWGAPTALSAGLANGHWVRNSGLPGGTNLANGAYTLYAVATDNVGNSSVTNIGVTVNTGGPIAPISRLSNNHIQLHFPVIAGKTYRIQASTNLSVWMDIGTVTGDASGMLQYEDTNAVSFPIRFYRTVTP